MRPRAGYASDMDQLTAPRSKSKPSPSQRSRYPLWLRRREGAWLAVPSTTSSRTDIDRPTPQRRTVPAGHTPLLVQRVPVQPGAGLHGAAPPDDEGKGRLIGSAEQLGGGTGIRGPEWRQRPSPSLSGIGTSWQNG
jgi:hypothetical protein